MVNQKPALVRVAKITISAALLIALLRAANWPEVFAAARGLDAAWLGLSLLLFVPQTVVSAWRWRRLVAPFSSLSLVESARDTLAASALNLLLPAKTGDFSKAAWLPSLSVRERTQAGGRIVVEKLSDVACLFVFIALGLEHTLALAVAAALGAALLVLGWRDLRMPPERRWTPIAAGTVLLWCLHLAQVAAFLEAAGVHTPLLANLVRVPLALFAGLMPGTFCGVGARDSALVWLYADTAPAATMAVVGLLTSLRYLVPGAAGIVVLGTLRFRKTGSHLFVGGRGATC